MPRNSGKDAHRFGDARGCGGLRASRASPVERTAVPFDYGGLSDAGYGRSGAGGTDPRIAGMGGVGNSANDHARFISRSRTVCAVGGSGFHRQTSLAGGLDRRTPEGGGIERSFKTSAGE